MPLQSLDEDDVINLPMQKPKFLSIAKNDDKERVEVFVKGIFDDPQNNTYELGMLNNLTSEYSTVVVYINSQGGQIDMLTELMSILRRFDLVITVGSGTVASAAFMLWSIGDVRVLQKYTTMMMHRESYSMVGKTDQHVEYAQFVQKVNTKMMEEICEEVLTEEELHKMRTTEVFFCENDMFEREVAIPWEQFCEHDDHTVEIDYLFKMNDQMYMKYGDLFVEVTHIEVGDGYASHELIYDLPNKTAITIETEEEEVNEDE